MSTIIESAFWEEVMKDVYGPRQGDAIIVIDAQDARKGVGKTVCAVGLAKLFCKQFGYELGMDDLCLSGESYLDRLREHPDDQPSAVVWDEAVGAGSGDGRRAMSNQNVVMGRAWQTMRTKQTLSFVTLPDWSDLDKRLKKLADYRVYCLQQPIGYFKAFKIGTEFQSGALRTYGLPKRMNGARRLKFPNLDTHNDPHYQQLSAKKAKLLDSEEFDADEILQTNDSDADGGNNREDPDDVRRQEQIRSAIIQVKPWDDDAGQAVYAAAQDHPKSREWVRLRVKEWENGEHRELVEKPPTA